MRHRIWQGFMRAAKRIGQIQAWIILTVFYFVVLAPVAVVFKLVADPLGLRRNQPKSWHPPRLPSNRLEWAKSQS